MTKDSVDLYSSRLSKEPLEDVLVALEKLSEMPRREYEPAIPDIGGLIALVQTITIARRNRLEIERDKKLVLWECPTCGHRISGWFNLSSDLRRQCQSLYGPKGTRQVLPDKQICGAIMDIRIQTRDANGFMSDIPVPGDL